ncbi:MAG: hypothetical protein JW909_00775 [Planctomycetes bacterium]|nr:hypothetical protein [Planctomycetota bacterium]
MTRIKTTPAILALLLAAGCGMGYFDHYDPEEAYAEYIRDNTIAAAPAKFGNEPVVFPDAHLPGNALPGFTVADADGRFISTFELDKGTVIVAMTQRTYTEDLSYWLREIVGRYGGKVVIIPVINLSQENWFLRSVMRAHTLGDAVQRYNQVVGKVPGISGTALSPGIDWRGAARNALALRGAGPYLVVAKDGVIKGFYCGQPTVERLENMRKLLDTLEAPVADLPIYGLRPLPAVSEKPAAPGPGNASTTSDPEEHVAPGKDIEELLHDPAVPEKAVDEPVPSRGTDDIMDLLG